MYAKPHEANGENILDYSHHSDGRGGESKHGLRLVLKETCKVSSLSLDSTVELAGAF